MCKSHNGFVKFVIIHTYHTMNTRVYTTCTYVCEYIQYSIVYSIHQSLTFCIAMYACIPVAHITYMYTV